MRRLPTQSTTHRLLAALLHRRKTRSPGLAVLILALAGAAGVLVGGLPSGVALALVGALAAMLAFGGLRLAFLPLAPAALPPPAMVVTRLGIGALPLPRLLFYGGALTVAQLTFRLPLNLTLSDGLFFAAIALAVLELLVFHRQLLITLPNLLLLGALLFAIGMLVSSARAEQPVQSIAVGARFLLIVTAWFWSGTVVLQTPAHLTTAVRLWTLSAAITGAGAVAQLMWGDVIPGTTPSWGRMTGFTPHMNELGGATAIAFAPALWAVTQPSRSPVVRMLSLIALGFIGAGLVLSGSVGSLGAAVLAAGVWLALSTIRLRTILLGGVAGIALAGLGLSMIEQTGGISPLTRLERVTANEGAEGSLWYRIDGYQVAWEVIGAQPFIGVGLDDESSRTSVVGLELMTDGTTVYAGYQVHNVLIGAWYTAGLLGMLGVLAILAGVGRVCVVVTKRARGPDERGLMIALVAGYAGFFVFALTTVVLYQRYAWIVAVFLLAAWAQITRRE